MLAEKEIDFYFYSGCGNTLLLVQAMQKVFEQQGYACNLKALESFDPLKVDLNKVIALAFSVAFQSAPPLVWDFVKKLPAAKATKIFMLDTLMGFSGAVVGPLKKLLEKKGYHCLAALEIKMPNNYFSKKEDPKKQEKIQKGITLAREYAFKIIEAKGRWRRIPFLSDLFYKICTSSFLMKKIENSYKDMKVDSKSCISCSLCEKLCPVNSILMQNSYPVFQKGCTHCLRCIHFCPTKSITYKNKDFVAYQSVSAQELLFYKNPTKQ